MQNIINKDRIKYQLPALSVSIKLPKENYPRNYVNGYYSLSDREKINSNTLFQIGSITKTMTATMLLKLVDENKISLHEKIIQWFPQYPRWHSITIENLLKHTSGISDYTHGKSFDRFLRNNPKKYFSLSELANLAYNQGDFSKPGEKYHYTNTDYILLGMVLEKVKNKSLQEIFDDYIKKYHLNNTFYTPNGYLNEIKNRIANGYNRDDTFKYNEDVTFVSMSFMQSAGAVVSTHNDLINWLGQLFTGKIVTDKSLNYMTTASSTPNRKFINIQKVYPSSKQLKQKVPFIEVGSGLGMGLVYFKNNDFAWVHAGGTAGYESFYAYSPRKNIYLVLIYSVKPRQQFIFVKIADDIFKVLNASKLINNDFNLYKRNSFCQ